MKKIYLLFLTLSLNYLNAQETRPYLKPIESLKQTELFKSYVKSKKIATNNKALSFSEAYYNLEYDTSLSVWDSISRTTTLLDSASISKGIFSQVGENYNGQGYIKADSSLGIVDTSYNSFKVPSNVGIFDTLKSFMYDSANATWIPFLRNETTVNSNKDITELNSYLNLAALGIPGGTFTHFGQFKFNYNTNQQLVYWIEKELQFGVGLINKDSVVVTSNANGYRKLDLTYEWTNNAWAPSQQQLYFYDSQNNLIEEIEQHYDVNTSSFSNSNRNTYTYNANGDVLLDSSFVFSGSWQISRIEDRTYTSFGDDLSRTDYAFDNGTPYIHTQQNYYYNANMRRDSMVSRSRQNHVPSYPLHFYQKEIYQRTPFGTGGSGASLPIAPSSLTVSAGTKSVIPTMNLSWIDNSNNETGFAIERSQDSITWINIDSAIANSTSFLDTTVLSNTQYHYRIVAYNGLGNSAYSNTASGMSLSVGLDEKNLDKVAVYPNPFNDKLNIEGISSDSQISLYSISGKHISNLKLSSNALELGFLSTGVYFLRINNQHKKIIKQ